MAAQCLKTEKNSKHETDCGVRVLVESCFVKVLEGENRKNIIIQLSNKSMKVYELRLQCRHQCKWLSPN